MNPEPGRDVCRDPEYVRTTTGWLVTVVRLDVDFADLLFAGEEWNAGALRARRAADCVGGSVFVNVVVVLGTEPVLAVRSDVAPCVSTDGAWARIAGTGLSERIGCALRVGVMLLPHKMEVKPEATECLVVVVVVAGVNVGGSALDSAMPEPWWCAGGAETCGVAGA